MVWKSSATVVGAAIRTREGELFRHAVGIDVGASRHWVAVQSHSFEESVREFGVMTL